jgi:hypothetical protein
VLCFKAQHAGSSNWHVDFQAMSASLKLLNESSLPFNTLNVFIEPSIILFS